LTIVLGMTGDAITGVSEVFAALDRLLERLVGAEESGRFRADLILKHSGRSAREHQDHRERARALQRRSDSHQG
jgi:hypothetical protein